MTPRPTNNPEERPSLGAVLDSLEDSFCLIDTDWRYQYVNRVAATLSGMEPEGMLGRTVLELFPSLQGSDFVEHVERALEDKITGRFQRRSIFNDRLYEHRIYPVHCGAAVVSSDVTEAANQKDEARQTERRLAAVFEQSHQFMAILDTEFRLLELNRWALDQMGLKAEDVLGEPLWNTPWWTPYEAPLKSRLQAAVEGRAGTIEVTYRDSGDRVRVLDCFISPVRAKSQSSVELLVVQGVDQTARRIGERHLRCLAEAGRTLASSLDYRETLARVAHLAVPEVADWASVYLIENGEIRLLEVAHMDPAKIEMAREFNRLYPPDPDGASGVSKVAFTGQSELVEEIPDEMLVQSAVSDDHLAACRELGLISYVCVPLVARGSSLGSLALLTSTDSDRRLGRSELKLAEQLADRAALAVDNARLFEASLEASSELKAANDEARRANRMKTAFLANMSHEIRTPMNGIRGMLEFLEEMEMPEQGREYISTIRQCSNSLLTILNDVLDLSRIEAGKLEIQTTSFLLKDTLKSISQLFRHNAVEKGLEYELEIGPNVPSRVVGDPDRLRQILGNLLNNAVKFTSKGSVRTRATYEEENLCVEVSDTGSGIPSSLRPKLFTPFSQGDDTSTRVFGGTGLGLSIVKTLAELMNGSVKYEPSPGAGSLFKVRLPMPASDDPVATPVASTSDLELPEDLKILIVEDNSVNLRVLSLQLARLNCSVSTATDGLEALEAVRDSVPRLILMDCQMPNLDGYEATRRIRKMSLESQPLIVALTAHAMKGEREKCLQAGMDAFLPKPVSLNNLTQMLASLPLNEQSAK